MSILNEMNQHLLRISVAGIAALLGLNSYMGFKQHRKVRESGFYKDSLELVRNYPPAVQHLGEPITGGRVTYSDSSNTLTDTDVCVSVPLYGPKGEAAMQIWSRRNSIKEDWIIDKLVLKVPNIGDWTFYTKDGQTGK
ncbi:uncharacterized protein LOC133191997 [Saccostrea echinata]|uniref:uncharacterized protein LOC133191997 n=1 Tax=Saccostrea echinata TaxID=191078 RepID=UPI002A82D358|nr:uncharacterized protein LOC133191997 [Saccostrea echinata]